MEESPTNIIRDEQHGSVFKKVINPTRLKFEDIVYRIKVNQSGRWCNPEDSKRESHRMILRGITGSVLPGEMVALLGPSGSGKTTLLTALGGRLVTGNISGRITYNGKPFSNTIKRCTGFVTQDDVLYPHLTVIETLVYTSLLRLPSSYSKRQKVMQAEAVVSQLGLLGCKNSIIGGSGGRGDLILRGISGGERKRVSIGQEMLINPSLLLLDEPTSGLDSTTAQRIVSILWELSKGGRTVVMTIHQPSSRLFYMFHKVLLLSDGYPIYFGNASTALEYFSRIGYAPSVSMNPADFLLDLANGIHSTESFDERVKVKQSLVSEYQEKLARTIKEETNGISDQYIEEVGRAKQTEKWNTTWWEQFIILVKRGIKERKHESFSKLKICQVLVAAFLSGLLWWQSSVSHLQDQIGLLFFYSGFWSYFPLFQAIFTFPQERMMLKKERSSGMYRLSSYFAARTVSDLPMELILPTVFITITYWMGGLKRTAFHFSHTLAVILYNVLVSQGMGLAIGALVMNLRSATTLASVMMLTFQLASGYYVQHIPGFIGWIKYLSLSHYTYKLLLGSQYTIQETYPCKPSAICRVGDYPALQKIGLDQQPMSAFLLALMLIGYRFVAYLALMRMGTNKSMSCICSTTLQRKL